MSLPHLYTLGTSLAPVFSFGSFATIGESLIVW